MSLRVPVVVTALVRLFPTDFASAPAFEHQRLSSAENDSFRPVFTKVRAAPCNH